MGFYFFSKYALLHLSIVRSILSEPSFSLIAIMSKRSLDFKLWFRRANSLLRRSLSTSAIMLERLSLSSKLRLTPSVTFFFILFTLNSNIFISSLYGFLVTFLGSTVNLELFFKFIRYHISLI